MSTDLPPLERWRLLLGDAARSSLGDGGAQCQAYDAALAWLYGREPGLAQRGERSRIGGDEASQLTVPDWLESIHTLFPKETIERLERDAVERYGIDDVVTNPAVLERVTPNETLLRAVLRTKHLMNDQLLGLARELVRKVVRQILEKLQKEVRVAFSGVRDRRRSSPLKVAKNLDFQRTIRRNLKHYDPERRRLLIERAFFFARTRRFTEKWQVILLVDQSGSMLDSTIHSAVTASCLWSVPGLKTHLVAFDTAVVDLTSDVSDPVEVLMKVQLGGGTDIAKALEYGASLIEAPRRAIVVLITDFFEGGDRHQLVRRTKQLCEQGTRVLGLAALDSQANPTYDQDLARELVNAGAKVGAMTPGQLAEFVAEAMK